MVKDYAEQILQAVDIVVGQRLNDIHFDKSENCTIVSDKDKKNGCYEVSNGSTRYNAYVEVTGSNDVPDYKVNDTVQVRIPNGDFSQKKYIVCKCVIDNDTSPITYVSPLDTVLDMTDNIISGENIRGLRANDENQQQWCLWSADCSQPAYRKLQNNSLYDTIAIKADFKTLLTGYNVNSGNYGLRLDMYFKPTNGTEKLIRHSAYLDSSDMYGNPYSFLIYSTQAMKFSIANIGTIQTISLYFYQNNNFKYLTDEGVQKQLPVLRAEDPDYSNLLVKNIYLSFGSDIININDNTVKLYTNEPLEYDRLAEDESTNTKGIGLLWYNKNDAGQYLGYSDGIVDRDYDEIAYLELSEKDSRLLAQQGKDVPLDENGLDLSADIVDAEKLLKKLKTSIIQDLYQMIWSFYYRVEGVVNDTKNNNLLSYFNKLTNSDTGVIATAGKSLDTDTKAIVDYYLAKLSNARAKMDGEEYTPTELTYVKPEQMIKTSIAVLTAISNDDENNLGLLEAAYQIISSQYAGFMSIYDSFNTKLRKMIATTQSYIDEFSSLMNGNDTRINNYFKDNYNYEPYVTVIDETLYSNRYCIYWYRYIPGYTDETERFMDSGWKRLTEYNNHGLPSAIISIDGIEYYEKRPDTDEDSIIQVLDTNLSEEKYCVIIFYNHAMYKSEPLVFTNQNPPQEGAASDQNGALYIEHGNNSRDTYQSYGVNNMLINVADAYQTRTLQAHYEGIMGQDEVLAGGQIFWYIPKNATMLTYDLNEYGTEFSNDIYDSEEIKSENSLEGYIGFYRPIKEKDDVLSFSYHIKDYYVPTSTNNEIICRVITKDNRVLEANILLNFSSYGTSGTDYTLVIKPAGFQNAITGGAHEENENGNPKPEQEIEYFDFDVALYDYNNEKIKLLYGSFTKECKTGPEMIGPKQVPYATKWLPEGASEETEITGCRVWIPDRKLGPEGLKDNNGGTSDYYYGVMQVTSAFTIPEIKNENGVVEQSERTINLSSICTIPYSDKDSLYQGQVYIEGPSIIVYDSSGANPTYYKNPFKIYSNNINKDKDKEIKNVVWMMKYYNEKGEDIDLDNLKDDERKKYQLLINWMPKLSSDNKLIPSSMYLERNITDTDVSELFPVVVCLQETGTVLWAQPIYMMQNRYTSTMLNEWDGSLCIDEENGTILAPMIGAGRKTINNTFEGVMMGDVGGQVHGDNATGIGIYGYHDGYQSFHFGIDGTAFLGKSGRGRIMFDGNSGTIASASWTASKQDVGMYIDLDDGIIDMRGAMVADSNYNNAQKAYIGDGYATHIQLHAMPNEDLGEAYFLITTPNSKNYQNVNGDYDIWIDKPLIKIGKNEYFLQTEDYKASTLKMGEKGTADDYGSGMKIDLSAGTIDAYNFVLKGESNSGNYAGSFIKLTSDPNGFIDAYLLDPNLGGIHVLDIGLDNYQLHSFDWYVKDSTRQGMEIDLNEGCITSYSNSNENKAMIFDASAATYPLQIGTIGNYNFKIKWDGALDINSGAFKVDSDGNVTISKGSINIGNGAFKVDSDGSLTATKAAITGNIYASYIETTNGKIGGWIINSSSLTGGGITLSSAGTISGGIIKGSAIDCGAFTVTSGGEINATSGKIGGWSIDGSTLKAGSLTLNSSGSISASGAFTLDSSGAKIEKGSITLGSNNFKVTNAGIMTAKGATLEDLTIKNSLSVEVNGAAEFSGNVHITGKLDIDSTTIQVGDAIGWASGSKTILVDVPYESGYYITIQNGLVTNVEPNDKSGWDEFWDKAFGENGTIVDTSDFASKEALEALEKAVEAMKTTFNNHTHGFDDTTYTYTLNGNTTDGYSLSRGTAYWSDTTYAPNSSM